MAVNSLAGGCGATLPSSLAITPGVVLALEAKLNSANHPLFEDTEASDTYVPVVTGKLQRSSYEMSWETQSVLGGI